MDILFLLFSLSDVRRPMSGVTHDFCSFKGKASELLSPNLVCRFIGSVACLGLLLAVVPLLLTEYSYFQYPLVSVHLSQNNKRYFTTILNTRLLCP